MQILLNTDHHMGGREAMYEHLESVVTEVLGRFGNRIACVQAHLTDGNGATTSAPPTHACCTLKVVLVGREPVIASHHAETTSQAIHGALRQLGCRVGSALGALERQNHRGASPQHRPEQTRVAAAQASA